MVIIPHLDLSKIPPLDVSELPIPVNSIDELEYFGWLRTKQTREEQMYLTDGTLFWDGKWEDDEETRAREKGRSCLRDPRAFRLFCQQSRKEVIVYHTHPHVDIYGNAIHHINPPSDSDFLASDPRFFLSYRDGITVRNRVIEKYGVWNYLCQNIENYDSDKHQAFLEAVERTREIPLRVREYIDMQDQIKFALDSFQRSGFDLGVSFRRKFNV